MRCPQCGESIPDDSRFCPKCGANLSKAKAAPKPPTPPAPEPEPAPAPEPQPAPEPVPQTDPAEKPARRGGCGKVALIAVSIVVICFCGLIFLGLASGGSSDDDYDSSYDTSYDDYDTDDEDTSDSGTSTSAPSTTTNPVTVTEVKSAVTGPEFKEYAEVVSPDFGDDDTHYLAEDGTVYDEVPWTHTEDDDGGLTFYSDYTHATKVGERRPEDEDTRYRCEDEYNGLYLVWMTRTSPRALSGEDNSGTYVGLMKPDGTWFGSSPLEVETDSLFGIGPVGDLVPTSSSPYAVIQFDMIADSIVLNFDTGLVESVEGTAGAEAALAGDSVIFRLDDAATRGTYVRYRDGEQTTLPGVSGYLLAGCKDGFLTDPDDGGVSFYAPDGTLKWTYSEHTVESAAIKDGTIYAYLRADGDETKYMDFSHYYLATLDVATGALTNEPFMFTARGVIGDTTFVSSATGDALVRISTGEHILEVDEDADFGTTGPLQHVEQAGTYHFYDGTGTEVFPHRA